MCDVVLLPGNSTGEGLPAIFEVGLVRTAVLLAIKLWIYKGASGRVVERVRRVENPFALVEVAFSGSEGGKGVVIVGKLSICTVEMTEEEKK